MATIGEIRKITIGGNTYTIPVYDLPIASSSTLGGVKVGTGLSIDATTGVLSTSITESDPVFSASAAAGITSSDISNWNSKVSDDKTWNGVTLSKTGAFNTTIYIPFVSTLSDTTAYYIKAQNSPLSNRIPLYDNSSYLRSTTPSANDNSTKVATTAYVDSAITALPEPMLFKGSLGTDGTITSLPTAAASNEGYTYKVITAGTYASQEAKIGDTFISDGSSWVLIPSGDEPSGTVTSVGISSGGGLSVSGSPITSSGAITISHADTSSQASSSNSGRTYIQSLTLDGYGHVTGISTATETVVNTDEKVKTTKASYNGNEYGIVLGSINATTETKQVASGFTVSLSNSNEIYLWLGIDNIKGNLCLANNSYYTYLKPSATSQRTITLPDKDGTVALTSDVKGLTFAMDTTDTKKLNITYS